MERLDDPAVADDGEALLRDFLEHAGYVAFGVAPDGRLLWGNGRFREVLGYGREALDEGVWLRSLQPPEERDAVEALLARALAGDTPVEVDGEWVASDGRRLALSGEIRRRVVDDEPVAAYAILRDVTTQRTADRERLLAHMARFEGERRFRAIFETTPLLVGVLEPDGTLLEANPASLAFLGRSHEDVVGQPVWEITEWRDPGARNRFRAAVQAAAAGSAVRAEVELVGAGGRTMTAEFTIAPVFDGDGRVTLLVPQAYDVTARRQAERYKEELIAVVGHELRTPLGAVRGALQLLSARLPELGARERQLLDMANRNAERLLRLLADLLDVERLEAGMVQLDRVSLSAGAMLAQARDLAETLAAEAGVELALDTVDPGLRVLADADRVSQVLTNLVGNALKFAPRGTAVGLGATAVPNGVRFTVRDEGAGVPPDQQERIFERFVQVRRDDARERGGAGLGLSIARAIVRQHGGRIGVESRDGEGSTFWFELPESE